MSRRYWGSWVAVATLGVLGGLAAAGGVGVGHGKKPPGPAEQLKALVVAQFEALEDEQGAADFDAAFAQDAAVWLPEATALATTPAARRGAAERAWLGSVEVPQKVKLVDARVGLIGAKAAWINATVHLSGRYEAQADVGPGAKYAWNVHVTALVERDQAGAWKIVAAQYAHEVSGADAQHHVRDSIVDPLAALPEGVALGGADAVAGWIVAPATAAANLTADAVLVGSSAKERAVGAAKVKKMLGGWKGVKLAVNGAVRELRGEGYYVIFANVDSPARSKAGDVVVQYRAFAIFVGDAESGFKLAALHFASPANI